MVNYQINKSDLKYLFTVIVLLLWLPITSVQAQSVPVVQDDFSGPQQFVDLSLLHVWGSNAAPQSAFQFGSVSDNDGLSYNALSMTDSAMKYTNYGQLREISTKALNCFDYHFTPITRTNDTIQLEFDVLWETLSNSGEGGRINVIFLHDYAAQNLGLGANDSVDNVNNPDPFGKPAYHFRLRNRSIPSLGGFVGWGGGNRLDGRLYLHLANGDTVHWLPGAVAESGTGNYPSRASITFNNPVASATQWRHITCVITPTHVRLFQRNSGAPASANQQFVELPASQNPSNSPVLHQWFDGINALRFYAYGIPGNRTYWANIKLSKTENTADTLLTSIRKTNGLGLQAYPNPFEHSFQLQGMEQNETLEAVMYNAKGQWVARMNGDLGGVNAQLAGVQNGMPSGLYLLKVSSPKGQQMLRVVKR